jgi:hypothetical protein
MGVSTSSVKVSRVMAGVRGRGTSTEGGVPDFRLFSSQAISLSRALCEAMTAIPFSSVVKAGIDVVLGEIGEGRSAD